MKSRFGLKLSLIMILFAVVISLSIATTDYFRLREQVIKDNQFQLQQIEQFVKYSLKATEKAHFLFDKETTAKMETNSKYLLELYKKNPSFDEWDFHLLKETLGMDIYIINDKNVITHSSFTDDIGLDFSVCCRKLHQVLIERRGSGEFYVDDMDIEQKTGEIKRYSYMATHDKKYLIQLGYYLQEGEVFQQFDFLRVIDELVQKYPSLNDINVLNMGGLSLTEPVDTGKLPNERRQAFEQTLKTKRTTELRSEWKNEPAIYRYVHYVSDFDDGTTKNKVLEIIYNDQQLQSILNDTKKTYIIQSVVILLVSITVALIISRWVSRPMYLAFHDSLTGLKNRAAFDELLKKQLEEKDGTTALLMIDLDNFKSINDDLGHDVGDFLLKHVAHNIRSITRKNDVTFRLGGDEFVILMPATSQNEAETVAYNVIQAVSKIAKQTRELKGRETTVSIGISLAPQHSIEPEELYKKADEALYASKKKGKNQYCVYSDILLKHGKEE